MNIEEALDRLNQAQWEHEQAYKRSKAACRLLDKAIRMHGQEENEEALDLARKFYWETLYRLYDAFLDLERARLQWERACAEEWKRACAEVLNDVSEG